MILSSTLALTSNAAGAPRSSRHRGAASDHLQDNEPMKIDLLFAGTPVSDFNTGRSWYELLFGRPADVPVTDHEVMWKLGEDAWLYVIADPGRAGRSLVTMSVSDLDQTIAELETRGITVKDIETIPGSGRKATVLDPDGNSVAIIEVLQHDK
jgi:predicted enzyme related to lactoylglutathione lyase